MLIMIVSRIYSTVSHAYSYSLRVLIGTEHNLTMFRKAGARKVIKEVMKTHPRLAAEQWMKDLLSSFPRFSFFS